MAGTVELGADLADLGGHELVVEDELLLPNGPPAGVPGMIIRDTPRAEGGMSAT